MFYLCEFELFPEEGMVVAYPFGLEGATCGADFRDAAAMAADWLKGDADMRLMLGHELPELPIGNEPRHKGGRILLVGVDASLENIDAVSAAEAAELLGVSRGRVTQMVAAGQLFGFKKGRNAYVSRNSLNARLAEAPKAGRPRKKGSSEALAAAQA